MKTEQSIWSLKNGWEGDKPLGRLAESAQLVLVFSGAGVEATSRCMASVRAAFPTAAVCGCSTSGEIQGSQVLDESVVVTAIAFESTRVMVTRTAIDTIAQSFEAGENAVRSLGPEGLRHILVLSDGLKVNGSELLRGINSCLPAGVSLSGGFAGDSDRMQNTYVWHNGDPEQAALIAIGFYGDRLRVEVASTGGWDPFGPERLVTRSKDNVLYEFDGCSALSLYKDYLGDDAQGLPASGFHYPIQLRVENTDQRVIRTLLTIDEAEQSMTFAGAIPERSVGRLMFGNVDRLIDGVVNGTQICADKFGSTVSEFALLISCVGRRPVLKQRVEEEVEAVAETFSGNAVILTGFYSYGEIAPTMEGNRAEIHNQTMTMTCFAEE